MPRLAKKMGIAPFTNVPNSVLIPIEYGTLSYYVKLSAILSVVKKSTLNRPRCPSLLSCVTEKGVDQPPLVGVAKKIPYLSWR